MELVANVINSRILISFGVSLLFVIWPFYCVLVLFVFVHINNICVMNFYFHNVMINGHTLSNVNAVERTFSEHRDKNIIL